jgi:RNA polymerase-binding transcription factor DksA
MTKEQARIKLMGLRNEILGRRDLPIVERVAEPQENARMLQDNEELAGEINRSRDRLKAILEALGRIEDGSWGLCVQCDEEISTKRLEALPWASLCVGCQSQREAAIRENLPGHRMGRSFRSLSYGGDDLAA